MDACGWWRWNNGGHVGTSPVKGYQLWIALPPEMESSDSEARYLDASRFQRQGPVRVILGGHRDVVSEVPAPDGVNYVDVVLKKGEKWRYEPPPGHAVAWVGVHEGELVTPAAVRAGELVVFEESNTPLEFAALADTGFILGSAVKHPYNLVLGAYSEHTSKRP